MFKKIFFSFLLLFSSFLLFSNDNGIPTRSNPPRLVNNYSATGFLNPDEENRLEQKLEAFANETSNQIVIVIIEISLSLPTSSPCLSAFFASSAYISIFP